MVFLKAFFVKTLIAVFLLEIFLSFLWTLAISHQGQNVPYLDHVQLVTSYFYPMILKHLMFLVIFVLIVWYILFLLYHLLLLVLHQEFLDYILYLNQIV